VALANRLPADQVPYWLALQNQLKHRLTRGRVDDLTALEISRPDIAEDTTVAPFELTLASTAGQDTDHAIFHLAIGLSHDREIVLGTRASTTVVPEILVRDRGL